ncbi:hypothetical protein [Kutzneria sp. 744]|uniref:hypothetical protein n=1 Tax=Kutzneria sp. (strain 744) TaxID=345341 RepID=UPI0018DB1D35|nr:hypothetical protein [Kutzneria sp. 744]
MELVVGGGLAGSGDAGVLAADQEHRLAQPVPDDRAVLRAVEVGRADAALVGAARL